eukprot:TRINITY_DN2737_c0_g5_i1.p1 TRINITY_DN2737_c0_g5~~TRINITY_DN2737_c0_g5_i1.p1  ORF type:complete len:326 (+),score=118.55 TRINITY_DN2737_c0_g5_i1:180-1157(+)
MEENSSNPPIDILEDAPADPAELSQQAQDDNAPLAEAPAEKAEPEEHPEATSKKYTNEDVYKMVSLVLHYPSGGHGGESFWNLMVKVYGNTLLEGRNGSGLRSRWRKLAKEHPSDLEEFKRQLSTALSPDFVQSVEDKIAAGVDASSLPLNSKAYAMLFPNAPKPADVAEKKSKRKKLEDGEVDVVSPEKKKKTRKPTSKIHIDLNLVARKDGALRFAKGPEPEARLERAKNLLLIKNTREDTFTVKDIKEAGLAEGVELCEKIDLERENIFKAPPSKTAKETKPWTEVEDMVVRHPERVEVYQCLVRLRGEDEVNKRKSFLDSS